MRRWRCTSEIEGRRVLSTTSTAWSYIGSLSASPAAVSPAPTSGSGAASQIKERLVADLKLGTDQRAKVDAIFDGMRDKFRAAREMPEPEKAKTQERNRSEIREKVSAILTPEQKQRYGELAGESQAARAGGGGGSGRIWIMGEGGKAKAVEVRFGLTDGSMTEIVSGDLKEGQEVIVGQQAAAKASGMPGPRLF